MNKLQELIGLVNPTKLKGIEVLGKSDTIIDKLYHLIQKGEVVDDEGAQIALYGDSNSKTALYQVKEKLYNKLLDSIFIIDAKEKNHVDYDLAFLDNFKYAAVFEFLSARSAHKNIFFLGNKILKRALAHNQAGVVVRVARILSRKSALIEGDEKKVDYYHDIYSKYHKIEELQSLAEYYWYKISVKFNKRRVVADHSLAKKADDFADDIERLLVPGHTCATYLYLISLRVRSKEIQNDHNSVLELVEHYLPTLKNYVDVNGSAYNALYTKKLSALITLRRYAEANKVAIQNLKYLREGQKTWFTLLEKILNLNLHEKKYDKAFEIYFTLVNHKGFKFMNESRREIFKVYRAYFQFFINIDLLDYPDTALEKKPFRYARFCNEVHIFNKDKKGVNNTIIVAQFLLLFTEGKYQEANDKIESVRSYARKHLRVDVTFRSNCFLKMLVKLVECDFHKAATMRKTKTLFEKLKNHPKDTKRLRSDVEIVPYEELWEIILDRIDNSFRGVFKSGKKAKQIQEEKN